MRTGISSTWDQGSPWGRHTREAGPRLPSFLGWDLPWLIPLVRAAAGPEPRPSPQARLWPPGRCPLPRMWNVWAFWLPGFPTNGRVHLAARWEGSEDPGTPWEGCGQVWSPQSPPPDGRDTPALVAREKGLFFRTVASKAHTSLLSPARARTKPAFFAGGPGNAFEQRRLVRWLFWEASDD